jgi:hypothetical protein
VPPAGGASSAGRLAQGTRRGRRSTVARKPIARHAASTLNPLLVRACQGRYGSMAAADREDLRWAADLSDEWMDVDDKGVPVAVNSFKYKLTAHKADKKKK